MKNLLLTVLLVLSGITAVHAQTVPSSRSFIVGIGLTGCGSGSSRMQNFLYNPNTNVLTNSTVCAPALSPTFSVTRAVVDYNPRDNRIYYFRRILNSGTGQYDTYVWNWAPGTCPTGPLAPSHIFPSAYLTVAFDRNGIGWMVNLLAQPNGTYNLAMTRIDFTTGITTGPEPIALPPGVNIYQAQGDYLITPAGSMFFAYNNKLFTINYQNFGSGLNATYIDTIPLPQANQNLIGLAYAGGDFLGSFIKTAGGWACGYSEIDMLTGDRTPITYSGTFSSYDNTSVTSSIGTAKELVSVTPTGTPGQYDVVYDIRVRNLGNFPISNVQVIDSLQFINGASNVVSASATMVDNPAGLILNPGYNGLTNASLLQAGQILPNFPVANNNVRIRVTARVNNIIQGQVYNNSAVATGTGFSSLAIRDSSTNGQNPDLNLNEIADDPGENQPTPFVITIAGEYPPCPVITTALHTEDFGSGVGLSTAIPGGGTSLYTPSVVSPLTEESYAITNNPIFGNPTYWQSMPDHTGNPSGRMMVVNADVQTNVIYRAQVNNLCSNLKYSFIVWASNISNSAQVTFCNAIGGYKQPSLLFRVRDAVTGLVLTQLTSGSITNSGWQEYGMRFVLPTGYSSVFLEVVNQGEGGCGNDLAIDDIRFGLCDPTPTVNAGAPTDGCEGGSTTMSATLSDPSIISGTVEYQWQRSTDNISFSDIAGANSSTFTIPSMTAADAVYYRVIVASAGNITSANCRYVSNSFLLTLKASSVAPTGVLASATNTCANDPVTLTVDGGSLGTNATWIWYADACGGTQVGTGSSIVLQPADTTTYFVRAVGDCNTTLCAQVTINAANCVVLPVYDVSLRGSARSDHNQLELEFSSDEPIVSVEFQRSTNGRDFATIHSNVPEQARRTSVQYTDRDLADGGNVYYYRAIIRTGHGRQTQSRVVAVNRTASGLTGMKLSPNPASKSVRLSFQSDYTADAEIKLVDRTGRVVYAFKPRLAKGMNLFDIGEVGTLPDGVYVVHIYSGGQNYREKLVIRH